jgi:DNA-binding transcriptional LysR family regulator
MLLDSINLNALRVFEAVFRQESMTLAAKELGLTQSGVSQHIERLESHLEVRLFDRVNRRLHPTVKARNFYEKVRETLQDIERSLVGVSSTSSQFDGEIVIGLPIEFGNSFILPLIPKLREIFPKMRFKIQYGFAAEINQLLLNDKMDLAFVDAYIMDSRISMKTVYTERHHLVCSKAYGKGKDLSLKKDALEKLDYVAYLDDAPIIKGWIKKEINKDKFDLNIISKSMDVQGVASLIKSGLGVGVLPEHAINKYLDPTKLIFFNNSDNGQENDISLAYITGKREQFPIKRLIEFFLDAAK